MKTKQKFGRILAMLLAVAVSPLYLLATDYYTKEGNAFKSDIYASKERWVTRDGTAEAAEAPSAGNNYWVVGNDVFKVKGGEFGGDSLSLGLPADMPAGEKPSWAMKPTIRIPRSYTFTIGDFRLYAGTIHVQNWSANDVVLAGTSTVYSTTRDGVTLIAYISGDDGDPTTRRSINLAANLKGEQGTVLALQAGNANGYWPEKPTFLILSGDFSEYHGTFSVQGSLILLNTATAFGCEADGESGAVYQINQDTTMALAADKSALMSRTRGVRLEKNRTLTLTTTNDFDGVSYSGYTVTFPVSGKDNSSVLAKSGDGTVTLDCACSVPTLRVDGGTLEFGANFDNSTTNLELAAGAKIALAEGELVEFASVTVAGSSVAPGFYTGTGGPAYATAVSWISGTGVLFVSYSETPAATVEDTWKAEGADGLMSAATSWVGESAPNLATGEFLPTFANAGSGAVVDTNSVVNGIVFNAPNDFALTGDSVLTVLGEGITSEDAASARTYTIAAPLVAGLSQSWDVGENTTVAVSGPFDGSRNTTVTKTGDGTLDISGANLYAGALAVTGGRLRLSGSFGRSAATDGALTKTAGATNVFAGATINKPVSYVLMNDASGETGELSVEAETTNVFKGRVSCSAPKDGRFYLGDAAVVVYENGISATSTGNGNRKFTFSTLGKITTNPLVRFCGEPSEIFSASSGNVNALTSYVTCRFETEGNVIQKYTTGANSRLEATVDYAWNGADGIGQMAVAGGAVLDVGSTRQCIKDVVFNRLTYKTTVVGDGGTLELAPTADSELSLTNMLFTESVSLQKHGEYKLTLAGAAVESYGDVTVTNGVLEFAADASWLNGTNVTVSGSGTLKINKANTFNRKHAVIRFTDNGTIYVPAGVTQVFAEGWDGDTKMSGRYDAGNSSCVTGGGAIHIGSLGIMMIVY